MPDLPDLPFYVDGQQSVTDFSVECLNLAGEGGDTYLRLAYVSDDLGPEAAHQAHVDPDGQGAGSVTHTSDETGNIVVQLESPQQASLKVGYILRLRSALYAIIGKPAPGRTKNQMVNVTCPVKKVIHPVIPQLLSSEGQWATLDLTEDSAMDTFTLAPLSNRSGGTFTFAVDSVEGWDALPAGLSLNASTGAITGTPTVAATSVVKFVATETIAARKTRYGVGWAKIVVAASGG